jgi:hypothetical protein
MEDAMNTKIFISTTGNAISRAECINESWTVESLLSGESVRCLLRDPLDKAVIYAGTQNNGILRSNDCGKTWSHQSLAGQAVKTLAISSSRPGTIYAGMKPPVVYKSEDGGDNWEELLSFRQMRRWFWSTPAEAGDPYVLGLDISPSDPNVIVAGIEYGATLLSTDGGRTWQGHIKGGIRDVHSMTFHATNGNYAYAAGGDGPGAISRDGGYSWQKLGKGTGWSRYGFACAADPQDPEIWYISAAPYGVFPNLQMFPRMHWDRHSNSFIFRWDGNRWKRLGGGLPQPLDFAPYALLTDPDAPGHLYAGLSNGAVWHTTDYGDNWEKLPFELDAIYWRMVML